MARKKSWDAREAKGAGTEAPAPKRRGRPLGSKNKPKTPGKVIAMGIETPRLSEACYDESGGAGRPTDYRDEYVVVARGMARLGATDFEIAEELGVTTKTIGRWRSKYGEFCLALSEGKDAFDDRAERSLAMRAIGYTIHTEKLFNYEGTVVRAETVEHYPPDVGAIKLWLGNRRPDKWKEKSEMTVQMTLEQLVMASFAPAV